MQLNGNKFTVLVTGANRGLGKALALQLFENLPNAQFLFTTRKSLEQTQKQCPQFFTKYKDRNFLIKKLQLCSSESIKNFVSQILNQKWEFDAIVNNAAMGFDLGDKIPDPQWAKALLYTNVIGTIQLTHSLLPLLKQKGRIINVSSKLGALKFQSKEVIEEFTNTQLEEQQIYTAVEEYIALCEEGDLGKWWKSVYGTSKMLLNAWSRFILKRKLKPGQFSIVISPGHCKTDMGGKGAQHTAQSGAKTIYDCIFIQNPSYDIFYHRGQPHQFLKCGPDIDSVLLQKKQK